MSIDSSIDSYCSYSHTSNSCYLTLYSSEMSEWFSILYNLLSNWRCRISNSRELLQSGSRLVMLEKRLVWRSGLVTRTISFVQIEILEIQIRFVVCLWLCRESLSSLIGLLWWLTRFFHLWITSKFKQFRVLLHLLM